MGPITRNYFENKFDPPSDRTRLLELIQTKALKMNKVILSTGRVSDYYLDCKKVTLMPEGAYYTAKLMIEMISGDVSAVGGLTLGADPIVSSIALLSYVYGRNIPALIIRKEPKKHGTMNFIEGPTPEKGAKVAVVDDVVTSGASLLKVIRRLSDEGFQTAEVLAIIDRQEGGYEAIEAEGYHLKTIFTKADLKMNR